MENVKHIAHDCVGGYPSSEYSWWARDGQGIELCRVCDRCASEKLSRYRPEILEAYTQLDVYEPIEEEQ